MFNIVVPQLGESVVEARVARWLKKEGDPVNTGDPVVELETEKIDLEVGADHAGVITSIKHHEGDDVKVGEVLAVVDEKGAPAAKAAAETKPAEARPAPEAVKPAPDAASAAAEPPRATPTARRIAREHDVDLAKVQGSGAADRVTKQDVQSAIAPPAPTAERPIAPTREAKIAPTPKEVRTAERREERVRMSKRRQTIARRLVEAQRTAAMLTTFNEVDMTAVMTLRERRKEEFKKEHGVSLGIASFFVKAAIAALRGFPQLNAEIQGDEIVLKHYCDIGIAVGAEGGLVVPVLRDADRMSFAEIELGIRDFAARAASGALTLEDLAGGTFTITNGGVFGSLLSTPILNPPQVGILGLHKIQDRAIPVNGQVVVRPLMYVALTYDHRIVDGREAVQFLVRIKDLVEDPANLLLVS
ncbi:MAG: 2-oxoglutarate dehydrogenase complex dihydrolipoyllysine-residue succinyltransferase [Acidobacteria bacterium]|nr:2-oxoglutarate dehydrogenase complex dihydrolipoyllysine-residue succinyltransferase [Acidobacteriota bacterium]